MSLPVHGPNNLRLQVENGVEQVVTNLMRNPFPGSTDLWTVGGAGTKSVVSGSARATFSVAGGPNNYGINWSDSGIKVKPGRPYSAAANIRASKAQRIVLYLQFLNAAGANVGNHQSDAVALAANTYRRFVVEGAVAPVGAVTVRLLTYSIAGTGGIAWDVGDYLEAQRLMLNEGATVLPYFDGSTANTSQYATMWTGTAHASTTERHPNVIRNLFRDPMGSRGAWPLYPAWEDSQASITTNGFSYVLSRVSGPSDSGSNRTGLTVFLPDVPVTPGTWVRVRLRRHSISSGHGLGAGIGFIDANGVTFASGTFTNFTIPTGDNIAYGATVQVPSGAVTARFNIGISGAASNAAVSAVISEIVVATAPASATLSTIPLVEPVTWSTNLLGPTHSIDTERAALDLGVMSAVVLDANLDPAVSSQLQPGREVRLQALVDGAWENLFVGRLRDADVDYVRRGGRRIATRIALEAVDEVAKLANERQRYGFTSMATVRAAAMLLTPYRIDGSVDLPTVANYGTGQAQAVDDQGNALDWLLLARDSNRAYVWVDRDGITNVAQQTNLPSTTAATFTDVDTGAATDALYGRVTAGFSTRDVINTVSVRWLTRSGEEMTETTYGPVRDAASVRKNGPRALTVTVAGGSPSEANARSFVAPVLTAHADPTRQARELTMPVRDTRSVRQAARLDLYDAATARFGTVLDAPVRIVAISHSIRTESWTTTYGFAPEGAIATPKS